MSEAEKNKSNLTDEKLFDPTQFSTLVINREDFSKPENEAADLIEEYIQHPHSRMERDEFLSKLKSLNAQNLLIDAINTTGSKETKTTLTNLCWQCGLDFSEHFLFFAELSCSEDFILGFESLTVMQDCGEVKQDVLAQALIYVQRHKSKHPELMHDVMEEINARIGKE